MWRSTYPPVMKRLVNLAGLSTETNVPERTLRTFYQNRKIPFIKVGFRTVLFDPDKVLAALEKFEVKAVTGGGRK